MNHLILFISNRNILDRSKIGVWTLSLKWKLTNYATHIADKHWGRSFENALTLRTHKTVNLIKLLNECQYRININIEYLLLFFMYVIYKYIHRHNVPSILGLISIAQFISFWFLKLAGLEPWILRLWIKHANHCSIKPWWLGNEIETRELNQLYIYIYVNIDYILLF